jgi:hypothetical protein
VRLTKKLSKKRNPAYHPLSFLFSLISFGIEMTECEAIKMNGILNAEKLKQIPYKQLRQIGKGDQELEKRLDQKELT